MPMDVVRLIKEAAEAAKGAPENLQEAAFNRAFEILAGAVVPARASQPRRNVAKAEVRPAPSDRGALDREQLDGLDRTAYPDIRHNETALLNSLRLLRAAKDELGVDGLSAATIARVLVDKFRCRITRQAVSMALNRAGRYVNRHNEGDSVIFRIMGPGEAYLDADQQDSPRPATQPNSKKRARPKARSAATKSSQRKKAATIRSPKPDSARTPKHRVGSWAATTKLVAEGFFEKPRAIGAIVAHLKENEGRQFKANEISPALLRLLRDKKLVRRKNADGQYEYSQA